METMPKMPFAGVDYPKDWGQFMDWYSTDAACRIFLEQLRWANGFVCPSCKQPSEPYRSTRDRIMCRVCRFQTSVTAGTIFEKTRTELRSWFAGIWYVTMSAPIEI